ncbi:hypothetical protein GJ496_008615 [Pomphorhynchus laevis]|nr:hypothetical protein GJ496_008615 [Pomphorhynchus laevis]
MSANDLSNRARALVAAINNNIVCSVRDIDVNTSVCPRESGCINKPKVVRCWKCVFREMKKVDCYAGASSTKAIMTGNLSIIDVDVNGRRCRTLLDTGCSQSIIRANMLQRWGIQMSSAIFVNGL